MSPSCRPKIERAAILFSDIWIHGGQNTEPRKWILVRRLGDRISRWVGTRPSDAETWKHLASDPGSGLGPLTDLLTRVVAEDLVARRFVNQLVPSPTIVRSEIEYKDLVIAVEEDRATDCTLAVRILEAPFSRRGRGRLEPTELRTLPIRPVTRNIRKVGDETERTTTVREIGEVLFRALFASEIRDAWLTHQGVLAGRRDLGIRLHLAFDLRSEAVRRVAAQPWEMLHDPSCGQPLCKNLQTPIVRSLATVSRKYHSVAAIRHVLLIHSRPSDEQPLEVESEIFAIKGALHGIPGVQVEMIEAELDQMRQAQAAHVIHFMGHGEFDRQRQEGRLIFLDPDGHSVPVSGKAFFEQLEDSNLRLVVLSACSGGETSSAEGADPFSGVAASLLEAGVPAVIAMQRPISDHGAICFASRLYEHLAVGSPLAASVTEARLALSCQEPGSAEWATPALYVGRS